jgi:hypothetical protein
LMYGNARDPGPLFLHALSRAEESTMSNTVGDVLYVVASSWCG